MRIIGHTFRPMDESDFVGFAGADLGSHICETEDCVLIASPSGQISCFETCRDKDGNDEVRELIYIPAVPKEVRS